MVTLLDLSDDDLRLLEMFDLLRPESQAEVLRRLSIAACVAVLARGAALRLALSGESPEGLTEAFLMRCMPTVPCGYLDDFGFEDRYGDCARPLLARRCVTVVLAASSLDAKHASELAADLTECATTIRAEFCAPDFEDGRFLDAATVKRFIEDWRDSFTTNLSRLAARPST